MIQLFSPLYSATKEVYAQKRYYVYTILTTVVVFSLNPLLRNYKVLKANFSLSLAGSLILGVIGASSTITAIILALTALLSGMMISFSIYTIKRQFSQGTKLGFTGLLLGILTPACPSCALGLTGILGLGGVLTILPLKGLELGFLGIILLLTSLMYLSKKINAKVCILKKK